MPRAFSISSESIAKERERVGGDLDAFDISRVIQLDEAVLREMGQDDVHLRILAVSAEHNVDHAALADTVNIADVRGGKIFPGNSALAEVIGVGADVQRVKPGDVVVTHCNGEPDIYGYPLRIWAYDQPDSIGWYGEEAVVGRSSTCRSTAGSTSGRSQHCRCARRPPITCGAAPSACIGSRSHVRSARGSTCSASVVASRSSS